MRLRSFEIKIMTVISTNPLINETNNMQIYSQLTQTNKQNERHVNLLSHL